MAVSGMAAWQDCLRSGINCFHKGIKQRIAVLLASVYGGWGGVAGLRERGLPARGGIMAGVDLADDVVALV